MTAFLALMKKDFLLFFQDRRAVLMSFVAPIVMGAFFGYVFGGSATNDSPGQTKILVVDQDDSTATREVFAKLKTEKALAVEPATAEVARAAVQKGTVPVAVVFPAGFAQQATQAFFRGGRDKPKLNLLVDPSHAMEARMIEGMLTGHVMQAVSKEAIGGQAGRDIAAEGLKAIERDGTLPDDQRKALKSLLEGASQYKPSDGGSAQNGGGFTIPFETVSESLTARKGVEYNAYGHSFAGFAVQFILFMGVEVGIGLLLLRQRGLWRRFRAAPLSKAQLLGSRAVSATLIAMLILSVVFLAARLLFHVRIEGSLAGFVAVGLGLGLMTATYGLLIASLGKTPEAARGLSIFGTIVMVMLSGAWIPSFLFPSWLQSVTKIVPARWAVDGLDAMVWRGLGWSDAVLPVIVLLASSLVFGLIALARFRWEGE
jgi:ABC-2 type transport system permease protein